MKADHRMADKVFMAFPREIFIENMDSKLEEEEHKLWISGGTQSIPIQGNALLFQKLMFQGVSGGHGARRRIEDPRQFGEENPVIPKDDDGVDKPALREVGSQSTECTICMDNSKEVLFLPCRHVCTCSACSGHVKTCPVCRSDIESRTRVFI